MPAKALKGIAVIGQSGGPTVVINQSLVGAVLEAGRHSEITGFYGALHGVQGVLKEDLIDLRSESKDVLERVAATPSAALGSVRKKPSEEECEKIFEIFRHHDVRYFFYIGGNDSAETAHIVSNLAQKAGYELRVCHIPKTIDNDLLVTDHCPGFGSAAKFVAMAFQGDDLDNRSLKGVKIDVIMGRHAGFLTASSVLGRTREDDGPHLVYVPEVAFSLDRFCADVDAVFKKHGRCIVAASEGIADENHQPVFQSKEVDAHGNVQLSGSGALGDFLAETVKKKLGISRVRADTFGYLQRCFPGVVSPIDAEEARRVGAAAIRAVTDEGHIGASIAIRRTGTENRYASETFVTPVESMAKHTRGLDKKYLAPEGNNITEEFVRYARPLIGDLPVIGRLSYKKIAKKASK